MDVDSTKKMEAVNTRYYLTIRSLYFRLVTKLKHEGMSLNKISRTDQRHSYSHFSKDLSELNIILTPR